MVENIPDLIVDTMAKGALYVAEYVSNDLLVETHDQLKGKVKSKVQAMLSHDDAKSAAYLIDNVNPNSPEWKALLREKLAQIDLQKDDEILKMAQTINELTVNTTTHNFQQNIHNTGTVEQQYNMHTQNVYNKNDD